MPDQQKETAVPAPKPEKESSPANPNTPGNPPDDEEGQQQG